ncbi:MAG: NAD(P)H-hydrate dehydratase [Terriglobia bacterium]
MKILKASQMQQIDRLTTERFGMPGLTLMENAGSGVVAFLVERFSPLDGQKIAIFCGKGNNGGDGLVVARLLRERSLTPRVLLFAEPAALKGDAAVNYQRLLQSSSAEVVKNSAAWLDVKGSLSGTTLIVDALIGTGLSKPLDGFLKEVVQDLNNGFPGASRVAVDLPSGLSADTGDLIGDCVRADASITFTAPKYAHVFPPACEKVGEWRVHQIGTPPEALEADPELFLSLTCRAEVLWLAAKRAMDTHKGTYGHVLVLAGSVGKTGAAAMAAKSALRSGAGLVTVATSKSALPAVAAFGMEFMTEPLPETEAGAVSLRALDSGQIDRLMEGKSVLAVGPGLGGVAETAELIREVVNRSMVPVVLDADGLNAFAGRMDELETANRIRVLTPHPGEMARLSGLNTTDIQKRRVEVARDFAIRHHVYLVLKGARTLVASPDGRVAVNPTGNPGMATGGAGDCLTGIIAGLLAQFPEKPVTEVLAAAVYLHGLAGDVAARKMGEASMIAGDLIDAIPEAWLSLTATLE